MKNNKFILVLVAFVVLVGILTAVMVLDRDKKKEEAAPTTNAQGEAGRSFTVLVVHADGTEKKFEYTTDAELLGQFLYDEGLLVADTDEPGMFHTVDGEKADWSVNQSYWAFYEGDQYANQGVETTYIQDGAVYKLVYTIG